MFFPQRIFLVLIAAFLTAPSTAAALSKTPRCIGRGRSEITLITQAKGLSPDLLRLIKPQVSITSRLNKKQKCVSKTTIQLNKKKTLRQLPRDAQISVAAESCSTIFKARLRSSSKVRKITLACAIQPIPAPPSPVPTTTPVPFTYDEFSQPSTVSIVNGITTIDIFPETYASAASLAVYDAAIQAFAQEAFLRQAQDEGALVHPAPATIRGRRLQGAVDFSNLIAKTYPATKVRVIIPPAEYNLLALAPQPGRTGYTSLSLKDAPYMPRLAIASLAPQSSIDLLSPWAAYPEVYGSYPVAMTPRPKLSSYDSECHTKHSCRARVLLLISVNQSVRVDGIAFEGDHDHSFRDEYEYYVHENPAHKNTLGLGRIGMVMVGTYGSAAAAKTITNNTLINNVSLSRINYRGIQIFGNGTVLNSEVKGIVEFPIGLKKMSAAEIYNFRVQWIEGVRAGITQFLHASDNPGQSWNTGIYIDSQFSSTASIIEHTSFINLLQGVVSLALGEKSSISHNNFTYILDHALYSLVGIKKNSKISYNNITRTFGFALKFAGHSDAADALSAAGVNGSEIVGNYFFHTRDGLIALSGSNNYIAHNRYDPYEPTLDETGGWFDPINSSIPGNSINPKFMISTFGGNFACVSLPNSAIPKQPGFSNTTAGNIFEDNSATLGSANRDPRYQLDTMTIFIDQAQGSSNALYHSYMSNKYADRSIDGNTVLLAGTPRTKAYFRKRTYTVFPAGIATDTPSQLFEGIPPSCKGCEYTVNSASLSTYNQNPCAN